MPPEKCAFYNVSFKARKIFVARQRVKVEKDRKKSIGIKNKKIKCVAAAEYTNKGNI